MSGHEWIDSNMHIHFIIIIIRKQTSFTSEKYLTNKKYYK